MNKQGETAFMVFSIGFTALVLLYILKLTCSDCCLCWDELLGFRTPASAPALTPTSAAAGPRPAPAGLAMPAAMEAPAVRRPCLCADPRAAVRRARGPVACVTEYRRSDGWREVTCPVCLCDFADGEVVRVLPACMHYFHAACVREWLRKGHATCPLCRAVPPSAVAAARSPEYVISMDELE